MGHRVLASIGAAMIAALFLVPLPAPGQDRRPDLNGVWDYRTITPLERSDSHAGKQLLAEHEAIEFEEQTAKRRVDRPPPTGSVGGYNQFWFDWGTKVLADKRSSLIVDPPDGRIPPLTPAAQDRVETLKALRARRPQGPEDLNVPSRCILGFNAGPPMNPSAYNNNFQLVQADDYVVILNEMVHDARIVPLDGRPHLPEHIRQWRGDSRGHWEGDTLVVDTTNFTAKTPFRGSGRDLHLIERFTLVDADTLLYEYTIDDPESFTKHWSVAVPMKKTEGRMFEYACHEGNYAMTNILAGARAQEKAEEAVKKGPR